MSDKSICRPGGQGIFLPVTEGEADLPDVVRGLMYAMLLAYFFVGVSIIADTFMAAIEAVTSRRQKTILPDGRRITTKVWNETVATLTLMALGSSAPEIFLSVIDLAGKDFHLGDLGPSTIVGSAAFNLLVIIAVCIFAIPSDEVRIIANLPAFYITAAFSLFAYVWLAIILAVISPDIVDIGEALATFFFLPLLVWVSYRADRGDLSCRRRQEEEPFEEEPPPEGPFIGFPNESIEIQGGLSEQNIEVTVECPGLPAGETVSCSWRTEQFSAVPDFDYEEAEGKLEFSHNCTQQTIIINIMPKSSRKLTSEFLVVLEDIDGQASFHPDTDGGDECAILTVAIIMNEFGRPSVPGADEGTVKPYMSSRMLRKVERFVSIDGIRRGNIQWAEQLFGLRFVGGDAEAQAESSCFDVFWHLFTLPWSLLFCVVPPTAYGGGWVCFYVSLGFIALLTAFVSDLAELFGCVLDVPGLVTAITFVALGTSMPDLFASLSAAKEDPTADASIVNVTGSNSVNVFLGIGVAWTLGAIYWAVVGRTSDWEARYPNVAAQVETGAVFVVESRGLNFSVVVFCVVCVLGLFIIHLRRRFVGGELGGAFPAKVASSGCFICYWAGFVGLVSWRSLSPNAEDESEAAAVIATAAIVLVCVTVVTVITIVMYRARMLYSVDSDGGTGSAPVVPVKEPEPAIALPAQDAKTTDGVVAMPTSAAPEAAPVQKPEGKKSYSRTMSGISACSMPSCGKEPIAQAVMSVSVHRGIKKAYQQDQKRANSEWSKVTDVVLSETGTINSAHYGKEVLEENHRPADQVVFDAV